MTDHLARLQVLESKAEEAKTVNARTDTLIEQNTERLTELLTKLKKEHGLSNLKELKEEIARLETEIEDSISQAEEAVKETDSLE